MNEEIGTFYIEVYEGNVKEMLGAIHFYCIDLADEVGFVKKTNKYYSFVKNLLDNCQLHLKLTYTDSICSVGHEMDLEVKLNKIAKDFLAKQIKQAILFI